MTVDEKFTLIDALSSIIPIEVFSKTYLLTKNIIDSDENTDIFITLSLFSVLSIIKSNSLIPHFLITNTDAFSYKFDKNIFKMKPFSSYILKKHNGIKIEIDEVYYKECDSIPEIGITLGSNIAMSFNMFQIVKSVLFPIVRIKYLQQMMYGLDRWDEVFILSRDLVHPTTIVPSAISTLKYFLLLSNVNKKNRELLNNLTYVMWQVLELINPIHANMLEIFTNDSAITTYFKTSYGTLAIGLGSLMFNRLVMQHFDGAMLSNIISIELFGEVNIGNKNFNYINSNNTIGIKSWDKMKDTIKSFDLFNLFF